MILRFKCRKLLDILRKYLEFLVKILLFKITLVKIKPSLLGLFLQLQVLLLLLNSTLCPYFIEVSFSCLHVVFLGIEPRILPLKGRLTVEILGNFYANVKIIIFCCFMYRYILYILLYFSHVDNYLFLHVLSIYKII